MVRRFLGKPSLPVAAALLLSALPAGLTGCGDRTHGLGDLLPGADPRAAELLARPEGPGFAAWAAAASADRLIDLHTALLEARHRPAGPGADRSASLDAALAAVDRALAEGCGLAAYAAESALLAALPADSAAAVVDRYGAMQAVFADTTLAPERKAARLEELQAGLLAAGFARAAAEGWYDLALLAHRAGDAARRGRLHRSSLALARRHGCLPEQSRAWGQLMMAAMPRGWTAAERDTLATLVQRARRARLAGTSTFLISLQAYDAFNLGRYGTARALFEEGIGVCRDLGDPDRALPTVDMLLRLYALFECWDQVDQLLVRAEQMHEATAGLRGTLAPSRGSRLRHATLAALSLAARGRADAAHAAFARALPAAARLPFAEAEYLGQQWVTAMMENGRADLAADALAAVTAAVRAGPDGPLRLRLPLWRAWLELQHGRPGAAAAHLDTFGARAAGTSPLLLANLAFQRDALQARALAVTAPDSAVAVLGGGWNRLLQHLHAREAGPEAYLDLARNTHLRTAAHDLLGSDPEVGYGLELLWRSSFFPRWPLPADTAAPDLAAAARGLARRACRELAAGDAVHCLYRVERDRVVRWTASAAGIARAVLPATPERLRALVTAGLDRLGQDPGDPDAPVPADLAAELALLAREVLPPRVLEPAARPRALFVSGDSFLAQFPYSPLNLDPGGGYRPLGASMDVAWLRGGPGDAAAADAVPACCEALVVADPEVDPATRRRFGLPATLPGAAAELAAISSRLPAARVLTGARATGPAVTAAWGEAQVIYFVGHAVRDAEVPFSAWLPLAAAASGDPYPGLDLQDVLAARLDRCRLVVLSGCATGAPYVDGLTTTPSLGDAFLDAGAGAVIQTFWRVRDEGSVFEPARVLVAWQEGGQDLAAAVSAERRRGMAGPDGIRHPFGWAAWTVKARWIPGADQPPSAAPR